MTPVFLNSLDQKIPGVFEAVLVTTFHKKLIEPGFVNHPVSLCPHHFLQSLIRYGGGNRYERSAPMNIN